MKINIIKGSILDYETDAIVNAANGSLLGGGGIDYVIHKNAGPNLLQECKTLNGCKTGDVKPTDSYLIKNSKSKAKRIYHAVGPKIYRNVTNLEKDLLSSCYKKSLELLTKENLKSISFPNISTGIYNFPKDLAVKIVYKTVFDCIKETDITVNFICFDDENYNLYIQEQQLYKQKSQ